MSRHKLELSDIRLESDIQSDIPSINGDFNQLQQCFINLIFNAIDAMPQGGTLTIEGRHEAAGHMVAIVVADTGQGIAPTDLPYIFEPFFSTKKEAFGVGLGLSTVYGIIERHGGSIRVESQPEKGTSFMLRLTVSGAHQKG